MGVTEDHLSPLIPNQPLLEHYMYTTDGEHLSDYMTNHIQQGFDRKMLSDQITFSLEIFCVHGLYFYVDISSICYVALVILHLYKYRETMRKNKKIIQAHS